MDLQAWEREFEVWIRSNFSDPQLEVQVLAVAREASALCRAAIRQPRLSHGTSQMQAEEDLVRELGAIVMAATWIAFLSSHNIGNVLLKHWASANQHNLEKRSNDPVDPT